MVNGAPQETCMRGKLIVNWSSASTAAAAFAAAAAARLRPTKSAFPWSLTLRPCPLPRGKVRTTCISCPPPELGHRHGDYGNPSSWGKRPE